MQRQAIRHDEAGKVLLEQGSVEDGVPHEAGEILDPLNLHLQVLLEELLQSGQFEAVARADDLFDLAALRLTLEK